MLYHTTIIFFVIVCMDFCTHFSTHLVVCFAESKQQEKYIYTIVLGVHAMIYTAVFWLMLMIFFLRLHFIFKGTGLDLSVHTIRLFATLFVIDISLAISLSFTLLFTARTIIGAILLLAYAVFVIATLVSIIVLFINKLINAHKEFGQDDEMIRIMTKTTILTFTSISISILTFVLFMIHGIGIKNGDLWLPIVTTAMGDFDILTNFLCVTLGYDFNSKYYSTSKLVDLAISL